MQGESVPNDQIAHRISPGLLLRLVTRPNAVFAELAESEPSAADVFFRLSLWLVALPPLFAFIGTRTYGWRLGAAEPLLLPPAAVAAISLGYFLALVGGFITTALIARWMSWTYGARHSLGIHFAVITVVGAPLAIGSLAHLYPDVFINVLVLVPVLIWSMYLLYKGLPVALRISPQQGMLMASSLIGYMLVSAVSLLGITVFCWVHGLGPDLGF